MSGFRKHGLVDSADYAIVAASSFFDAQWYLSRYGDVASSGMDPVEHYLVHGAREGRSPGPEFDSQMYLDRRPDVLAAGLNPLLHFLRHGLYEIGEDMGPFGIEAAPDAPKVVPKGRRKAVFVTHELNVGGAPKLLADIVSWFQFKTDYDVYVVSMRGGPLEAVYRGLAPLHVVGELFVPPHLIDGLRNDIRDFVGGEPAFTFINSAASGHYCLIDPFMAPVFAFIHEMDRVLAMVEDPTRVLLERADHIFCGGGPVKAALASRGALQNPSKVTDRSAFVSQVAEPRFLSRAEKADRKVSVGWDPERKVVIGCGVAHWRKQPDLFVRMAADLIRNRGSNAHFVWVGHGEDLPRLDQQASDLGIADRLEWTGYREDYQALLAAADVFALPSVEDPFPLVCLEAALASVPSVVFREATGMVALIEPENEEEAGRAVALGDEAAFFDAIDDLLRNDEAREILGRRARDRVLQRYTIDSACSEMLGIIRDVAKLSPRVSVIVPNYNCAPYLEKRLQSIAMQSFKDVEVLLFDDQSSDDSRSVLLDFVAAHPYMRLNFAAQNSGGVFQAWTRGVDSASGDLIWIAEADDWCEDTFLEKVVVAFAQSGVRLVHGRSVPMDSQGNVAGDWNHIYLDKISAGRWRRSYTETAAREIASGLGWANTIPNVSAVVVLRECAVRAVRFAKQYRLAGDWAFYVSAIAGGRITYLHDAINYHRRHDQSVTQRREGSRTYFQELIDVEALIDQLYGPSAPRAARFRARLESEVQRFGFTGPMPSAKSNAALPARRPPGILYCVGDLSAGGAQMFAVRFASRWSRFLVPSVLLVAGHEIEHPATLAQLSPAVPVVTPEDIAGRGLKQFLEDWGIDVIVSGHWWADRLIGELMDREEISTPWVIIMHGCYENVLNAPQDFPAMLHEFSRAERHCDQWIWTAEKNKAVFERGYITPKRTGHIVNGFQATQPKGLSRKQLGLPDDSFVFTLASRAIEEKGWLVALEAFREVRHILAGERDVRLQLIGDGPVAQHLRSAETVEGLHLVPHTSHLADYIQASDVGLLPSWFAGESLPLVLLEFLAQGKPAIVSDIGECAWVIAPPVEGNGTSDAGVVVSRRNGKVDPGELAQAMLRFVRDPDLRDASGRSARSAFEKFDYERMIGGYMDVFEKLLDNREPPIEVEAAA